MSSLDPQAESPGRRATDEEISALLDGRIVGEAREELLGRIADSDLDRRFLSAAAELLDDGDVEERASDLSHGAAVAGAPHPPAPPPPRPSVWRRRPNIVLLIAAGLLIAVMIPLRRLPRRAPPPADDVEIAWFDGAMLVPGWSDISWSVGRGSSDVLSTRARSVRIGARSIDVLVAQHSRDSTAVLSLASELRELVSGLPSASDLPASYRAIATQPSAARLTTLVSSVRRTRRAAEDPFWYAVGEWAETARLQLVAGKWDDVGATRSRDELLGRILTSLPDSASRSDAAARAQHFIGRLMAERGLPAVSRRAVLDSLLEESGR